MFEDAGAGIGRCEGPEAAHAGFIDDDQLARFDIAQIAGADHVQRYRFGGEDGRFPELAHDQRTNAERIATGNQALGRQADQRVGALDLAQRVSKAIERGRIAGRGDEVDDHLCVAG
jgi:hypothetical protein